MVRENLGVDAPFSDATGDQLGILGTKIENENLVGLRSRGGGLSGSESGATSSLSP